MLTWRKEWIGPFDSTWSIFEKIRLVNSINETDLLSIINPEYKKRQRKYRNINTLIGFNLTELERQGVYLRVTLDSMERLKQIVNIPIYHVSVYHSHLVYCSQCLDNDYHSFLHQFKLINNCPFHLSDLIDKCEKCNKVIYVHNLSNNTPFCCSCGQSLKQSFDDPLWKKWGGEVHIKDDIVLSWLNKVGIMKS
ncbi:hypothetical protein A8709_07065 [Paenibacillus pectinilyticus]|uniref:Uncharacterized protein n=2 Tax=Paenibacillus pectinilyticus TaxID=512399 RepID=A0A1C0ZTS8_9BACL|nr:TniQ family protein [Paenibacillus pectinilyticus]OCT11423.1 hypothetical protein A8709_07065 [Paenibacillus pectinilyticus]